MCQNSLELDLNYRGQKMDFDSLIASEYRLILDQLGVNHLSPKKSLISKTGSLKFAQRFRVARGTKDFSPVSLRPALPTRLPF